MSKNTFCRFSKLLSAVFMLLAIGEVRMQAASCTSESLADLIALNQSGGCNVGDFNFIRFSFGASNLVNTVPNPSASDVDISFSVQNGVPVIGFSSSSLFQLTGPASATYNIGYTIDPPPIIYGEDLNLDPPTGNVRITQNVCLYDVLANGCAFGTQLSQFVTPSLPASFLSFGIRGATFVDYLDVVQLVSTPESPAGFDSVTSAPSITPTPEPGTAGLLVIAGCVIGGLVRRRLKETTTPLPGRRP